MSQFATVARITIFGGGLRSRVDSPRIAVILAVCRAGGVTLAYVSSSYWAGIISYASFKMRRSKSLTVRVVQKVS